ncbi:MULTISPECIES: dTDP-4-dehydrorhamnose reductase [unclassified Leifsonia]|uniref:dTDP-4-dehydrorhamnose reductase n=1 Tax=unclassified Leifsonia TaxID=2663824 RepID=UPI0006F33CD4|nr:MULTISPECIES: dTDP-4-dehydrorhamnose reductase [unclassified Leifsonia]KQX06397.1 NAD(P)-dependent oxidoreductase [Leifsonia sp. Root1293]KRA10680.1 NAD(P)-dependent oxidoreductase [Leifsonia sp. Root60]
MTRYLVTGASGMLGHDLVDALDGRDTTALTRADLDITDLAAVRRAAAGHDVIINASAYTAVDDAETHEEDAHAVNALGAANLARVAAELSARFVQFSTDYVFDGTATSPYAESEPLRPVSAYGRTKAAGERSALELHPAGTVIIRTAWLYGVNGANFARTMLAIAAQRETWSVVDDQVGQPTWTRDLARRTVELLDSDAPAGIYHGTNSGATSWYGFARAVLEDAGLDPERITPTDSASFRRPAPRPAYSVLGHDGWALAGLPPMRDWRAALDEASSLGVFS